METAVLETAVRLFAGESSSLQRLSGGNFSEVYSFKSGGKEFILRLTPPDGQIEQPSMESILHWMQYLANQGLNVPHPLPSVQGNKVEKVTAGGDTWLVTAVEKAPGIRAETLPFEEWHQRRFEALGRITGKMHVLGQQYQPPAVITPRPQWDETGNNYNPLEEMEETDSAILVHRNQVLAQINTLTRSKDYYGLIHGDLQCANFFIDPADGTITLFDFDDCCYGWFLMDIALPLLDFLVVYPGLERENFASSFLLSFIHGYLNENHMEIGHLYHLPLFLKLLEIGLYIEVAPFADECEPDSWVGKFMAGRKENIEKGLPFVEMNMRDIIPDW